MTTDALLFSIALIMFGTWVEVHGLGGWPFSDAGIALAAIAFFASLVSSLRAAPQN